MGLFSRLFTGKKNSADKVSTTKPEVSTGDNAPSCNTFLDSADRYLTQSYIEEPESRKWNSDPRFKDILNPLNSGDNEGAVKASAHLVKEFSDLNLIYDWWATALLRANSYEEAREVVGKGLARSKSKFSLCNLAGEIEWKTNNLEGALFWWAQALHCQMSFDDYGDNVGCFLYLYYLAQGFGLQEAVISFVQMVDLIRPGQIRLNAESSESLIRLVKRGRNDQLIAIIDSLHKKYFCKKKLDVDENVFQALIKRAMERERSPETRVAAIHKLAEIGDHRAIEYLQKICDNEMGLETLDAKAAIKKILAG